MSVPLAAFGHWLIDYGIVTCRRNRLCPKCVVWNLKHILFHRNNVVSQWFSSLKIKQAKKS